MAGRYRPVGWRNEPHRHSLAARGISTKRPAYFSKKIGEYFSEKKKKDKYERCVKDVAKDHPDGKDAAYGICGASLGYVVTNGEIAEVDKAKQNFAIKKTAIQEENDIEGFFTQETGIEKIDQAELEDDVIETRMSPDEFMQFVYEMQTRRSGSNLTFEEFKAMEIDDFKTDQLRRELDDGILMKTPYIEFEGGEAHSAQGLHRAAVAKEMGFSQIPVVMYEDEQGLYAKQVYAKVSGPAGETVDKMSSSQFKQIKKQVESGQADGITKIEETRPPIQEFVRDELRSKSPEVAQAQMAAIQELREEGEFPDTPMAQAYEQEVRRKAQGSER